MIEAFLIVSRRGAEEAERAEARTLCNLKLSALSAPLRETFSVLRAGAIL
jgi:hypothetical protein